MARSHHIYIVQDSSTFLAAFTVKHECDTYLERSHRNPPVDLKVLRLPDGRAADPVDITHEFYEEAK